MVVRDNFFESQGPESLEAVLQRHLLNRSWWFNLPFLDVAQVRRLVERVSGLAPHNIVPVISWDRNNHAALIAEPGFIESAFDVLANEFRMPGAFTWPAVEFDDHVFSNVARGIERGLTRVERFYCSSCGGRRRRERGGPHLLMRDDDDYDPTIHDIDDYPPTPPTEPMSPWNSDSD